MTFVRDGTGDGLLALDRDEKPTDAPLSSDMDLKTAGIASILIEAVAAVQSGADVINVKGGPRLRDCERLSRFTLMDDAGDPRWKGDVERNGVGHAFSAILSPSSSSGM
jgi:hypothetical protein